MIQKHESMIFTVWDKDPFTNDYMGEVRFHYNDLILLGKEKIDNPIWFSLDKVKSGEILLIFLLYNQLHTSETLREKCPYSEFFWSVFSRIQTKYGEIRSISPYSVRMWKNKDKKNSEYRHFSRSKRKTYCNQITDLKK